MRKLLFLSFILIYILHNGYGQIKVKEKISDGYGVPKFVLFEEAVYKHDTEYALLKEQLNLQEGEDFRFVKEMKDELGEIHKKFQQFYKGIKVEYGSYRIHLKDFNIKAISGNCVRFEKIDIEPVIHEKEALDIALDNINAKLYIWDFKNYDSWIKEEQGNNDVQLLPEGELVIWSSIDNSVTRLAYKFDVYTMDPLSRANVFIDALTGDVLEKEPTLTNSNAVGTFTTRYSGQRTSTTERVSSTSYRLRDFSRGNGIITKDMKKGIDFSLATHFIDNNNTWTAAEWHNANEDDAALEAHWALQKTYDYFKTVHNRNSFDNNNAKIYCYVHFDNNVDNGFWDGSRILISDGNMIFDNVASLDVIAHEFGHAICDYTCDLRYQKESGAINESLSDIWGVCVENYAAPEKQIWRIAEDITNTAPAFRYLDMPNLGSQPDTYEGNNWINPDCSPAIYNDYCGVHTNSGVMNHWFFLLVNGGRGTNDNGDFFNFEGIDINSAAKIVYRLESIYLNSNSNFADARTFSSQAAKDLYGSNSTARYAVEYAWYAVGVGTLPSQLNNNIVGPTQLTPGYSASYSVTRDLNATNYVWIIPSGCYSHYCWNITSGQGTNSINVKAGAIGSGTIRCNIYNGSTLMDSKSLNINVQDPYGGGSSGGGGEDPCDGSGDEYPKIINGVIYPPEPCDENTLINGQIKIEQLEIYNLSGHKIFHSTDLLEFDTSSLQSGIYLYKIVMNDNRVYTDKFIVK